MVAPDKLHNRNRTTTLDSLIAFVRVLLTDSADEFIRAYCDATHDDAGQTVWFYMYKFDNNASRKKRRNKNNDSQ